MSSESSPKPGPSRKRVSAGKASSGRNAPKRAPSRRARKADGREFSAGGVVVRGDEVVVIVPTRRAADGSRVLALPKGHVDPGEAPIEAAAREVREETGILVGEPVCELGESRYWYRRAGRTIGKSVVFYLFESAGGDTADHDDEVEEVRWIALEQARTALSHQAEREMVELALAHVGKDR
ncbi:MAG TPA: NUDIX domain-containing protein [Solirubrobacteraceae bacterium]|nr:NUDIX domain-containing protein [Solirubrobacteraceae bacterium]